MSDRPNIFGMPVFVDDQAPPGHIALIDVQSILKRCPRDAQGRLLLSAAVWGGHVVYLSIDPMPPTAEAMP